MPDGKVTHSTSEDLWNAVSDPALGLAPFAFKVLRENQLVRTVRIEPEVTYIGRMPENHVVLDDAKVSRSHARVLKKGDQYVIEDQQSENGIYVNGKKVKDCVLKPGVLIGVGAHVLEVVKAQNADRPATRESQLDRAEEEEWRMDQTISGTPEQLAKLAQAKGAKQSAAKMSFKLQVGEKTIEKQFEISQGHPRKEGDKSEDCVEVKITSGKWVMYKKVPM